jgi:predicted transcriptional regulator YdeE
VFIGYQVDRVADDLPADLAVRTVPAARYLVLTSERGPVVPAVQAAWQHIWSSSPDQLGAERSFVADFEVFGEEGNDFDDGEVDIYVSIR